MHHDPAHLTAFLIGAAIGVIVATTVLVVIRPWQRRIFAGPRLDAWQQVCRQLRWADQWRVIWATQVNHLTGRAALAHAQLVYVRYRQDAAKRSIERQSRPGLWKGFRLATAAVLGFTAIGWWATAAMQSHGSAKIFPDVAAAWSAFYALYMALALPRSWRRLAKRMARLQAKIDDRYAIQQNDEAAR